MKKIAVLALLPAVALLAAATPAGASVNHRAVSATSRLSDRPDSGTQGNNWADDTYTRTVKVTGHGAVPVADCGGTAVKCYNFTFTMKDKGTFTTIAGQDAPRDGVLDLAVTGSMAGGTSNGQFYSSSNDPQAWRVTKNENDGGNDPSGDHTTTDWAEQFFPAGTVFSSAADPGDVDLGSTAGWTYRLNFGQDPQCPNDGYQWVDAAPVWGVGGAAGNILAPGTADCM